MTRIPVGRCIAQAYGFLFGRILTIVTLSWVAAAFYGVLRFGLFKLGPLHTPLSAHIGAVLLHLGGFLAAILLLSAIAIPVTREALGRGGEWVLAWFRIGAAELRFFFALIRVYLIMIGLGAIGVLATIGATMGARAGLEHWPAAAQTGLPLVAIAHWATAVLAVVILIYAGLRLSFLLYPVAAAEDHASLRRAWALGKGNVLRMLIVVLAFAVPVLMIVFAGEYWLMGQKLIGAIAALSATHVGDMPLANLFAAHDLSISIAAAVVLVVMLALHAGASATAYHVLTGEYAEEDVEEEVFEPEFMQERIEPRAAPMTAPVPDYEHREEPAPVHEEPAPEHPVEETGEAEAQPFDEAYIEPEAEVPPEPAHEPVPEPVQEPVPEEPLQESQPAPAEEPYPQASEDPVAVSADDEDEHVLTEDDVWVQEDEEPHPPAST